MRKKLITWLVSLSMIASAFAPAVPAYAAVLPEETEEDIFEEAFSEIEPGISGEEDEDLYGGENEDSEAPGEAYKDVSGDLSEETGDLSEEAGDLSEEIGDASEEEAMREIPVREEEETVLAEDSADSENDAGFADNYRFGLYLEDALQVTFCLDNDEFTEASVILSKAGSQTEKILGTWYKDSTESGRNLAVNEYPDLTDMTDQEKADALKDYYSANAKDLDVDGWFDDFSEGEYKLFARYKKVNGDDTTEEADSDPVTITIAEEDDGNEYEVTGLSGALYHSQLKSDGSLKITSEKYNRARLIGKTAETNRLEEIKEGSVTFDNLPYGRIGYYLFNEEFSTIEQDDFLKTAFTRTMKQTVLIPLRESAVTGLEVKKPDGTSIDNGGSVSLRLNESLKIGVSVLPENAAETGYKIISSDPSIVSADRVGNLKALKAGEATVTVTADGKDADGHDVSSSFTVTVDTAELKKLKDLKPASKIAPVSSVFGMGDPYEMPIELVTDAKFTGNVEWTVRSESKKTGWKKGEDNPSATLTTSVKEGKTSATLSIDRPEVLTVTATATGEGYEKKQISFSVTANGVLVTDKEHPEISTFYQDGQPVKGLFAVDENFTLIAKGKNALKAKKAVKVMFGDFETGLLAYQGVVKVDKKWYLFNQGLMLRKQADVDAAFPGYIYQLDKSGAVKTGWIKSGGKEYYIDPSTGKWVPKGNFVPRGKGFTYLFENDGSFSAKNGAETIGEKSYYFEKGICATGFAYFDKDENRVSRISKADSAFYFDPDTGAAVTGPFVIKGKKYVPSIGGMIPINRRYQAYTPGVTYYFADKKGAVITNRFVSDKDGTYYADPDGKLYTNCTVIIKGVSCTFDAEGRLLGSGDFALVTGYLTDYTTELYVKLDQKGKPEKGVSYYQNYYGISLIKDEWIYENPDIRVYHTDGKGKLQTGLVKIGDKTYWFDPETARLGTVLKKNEKSRVVTWKKKLYLCLEDGTICTEAGFRALGDPGDKEFVYVKNETGELATGLFTDGDKTYIFSSSGKQLKAMQGGGIKCGKKYYAINTKGNDPEDFHVLTGDSVRIERCSDKYQYMVNKDGSVKTGGWQELNGKKYYAFDQGMLAPAGSDDGETLFIIKGKMYLFSDEPGNPCLLTGWRKVKSAAAIRNVDDTTDFGGDYHAGPYYFFFDPKSGAAITGLKRINAPLLNGNGSIKTDLDGNPVAGEATKELYFNTDRALMPLGALVTDGNAAAARGKIYHTGKDGSVTKNSAGLFTFEDADGNMQTVYRKKDGTVAKGRTEVTLSDGSKAWYYFDLADGHMEKYAFRKTKKKWYYYGRDGRMSFDPELTEPVTETVYNSVTVAFNSDGSIKAFSRIIDGVATPLKNGFLQYNDGSSGGALMTGKDALPATGMQKGVILGSVYAVLYFESDGKLFGASKESMSGSLELVKIGKKYYVSRNGAMGLLPAGAKEHHIVEVERWPGLPAADAKVLNNEALLRKNMNGSSKLRVRINEDGSVYTGTFIMEGKTCHTNKYGVIVEDYSWFVKSGKNWTVSEALSPGSPVTLFEMEAMLKADLGDTGGMTEQEYMAKIAVYSEIRTDRNGKLKPLLNKMTGKPVSGCYMISSGSGEPKLVLLKNGLPAGGVKKFSMWGATYILTFDAYGGMSSFIIG
ncbi:MAG: Ig-like domain-containing protein [Lachnospiraceae bacterium]|nr:Ig-like domain-containing protein [Lachnospiraceae bacterium]